MGKSKRCADCGRLTEVPEGDEGRDVDICHDPGSEACLRKAILDLRTERGDAIAMLHRSADLNCNLVSQNAYVIRRNTSMEAVIRTLVEDARSRSSSLTSRWLDEALSLTKGEAHSPPPSRSS